MSLKEFRRFMARFPIGGDGCWEWTGTTYKNGYGQLKVSNKNARAHRLMWALVNGPIPAGLFVCHHCDNRRCLRPDHLFIGTVRDNAVDMTRKGRGYYQRHPERARRGIDNNKTKLTEAAVRDIRRAYQPGTVTLKDLGAQHGMHWSTIHRIVRGVTWKHLA